MIRTTAALLTAGMLLTGCNTGNISGTPGSRVPDEPVAPSVPVTENDKVGERTGMDLAGIGNATYDQETQDAYLEFALSLYNHSFEYAQANENTMISPASVLFALGMTSAGAGGNTLEQMVNTMAPGQDAYSLHAFAGDYNRRLNSSEDIMVRSANSIWINESKEASVYSDFLDYVTETYDAQIGSVPFDPSGVETMNNWVNSMTNGMIDRIVSDELTPDAFMVLINAIAFEAEWSDEFSEDMIHDGTFRNSDGSTSDVTMLREEEGRNYFETDFATGFARYYGDQNEYYFLAILPTDETVSANDFAASLTAEDYSEFINSRTMDYNVIYELPEFESDYNIGLNRILQDMGIVDAFDENTADFSNMSDTGAYITSVIHKTHIEVDSEGTRAAAATAVFTGDACVMEPDNSRCVILDRPFAYAIVESSTGLPLFIGTVNSL